MTTSYPAGLDSFTNPTATDGLDDEIGTRTHSEFHADNNDAIEAIQAELGTDPSGSEATVKARIAAAETATANHLADTADAHAASAITNTPAGNIAATTVQAAINELDTEKLATATAATTYQPLDSDLTAIAALTTTSYGRALLELANQAALTAANAAATTSLPGIVELATTTETAAGTDTSRAVTAAGLVPLVANDGPIIRSGYYFGPTGPSTTLTLSDFNVVHYVPFIIDRPVTVTRISAEVTTALASAAIRLGIYTDVDGVPTTLLVDGGTIDGNSATVQEVTISQALSVGRVWVALVRQGGTGTSAVRANTSGISCPYVANGAFTLGATTDAGGAVTGAFPSTAAAPYNVTGSSHPRVMLKAA